MPRTTRDDELAAAFGARVRVRRQDLGLSQEAFAVVADVHRTFVGLVERGETLPSLATIVRFAEALGVEPGQLIDGLRQKKRTRRH